MSDSGALPRFVREAMAGDESARNRPNPQPVEAGVGIRHQSLAVEAEQSLLALEDSLSDVVEVEAVHVRVSAALLEQGPARLASSVMEPPHRYAPFFARTARFFDLSEELVIAALTRLREPAKWSPTRVPGVSTLAVKAGPAFASAKASLIRIDPGVTFVEHGEGRSQRVLVLEGRYQDADGVRHRAGDLSEWSGGAEHSFKVELGERCILASLIFGQGVGARLRRAFTSIGSR